jgi:hypothetical protein
MAVSVPPTRNEGDGGHIADHNQISADLATLSTSVDDLNTRFPSGKITVSDTAPTSPALNDIWLDTSGAV